MFRSPRSAWLAVVTLAGLVAAKPARAEPLERAIVPLVGGDTDVGIGGGAIGSLARLDPGSDLFRWKLEGAAFATIKLWGSRGIESPFQDVFLRLILNDLLGDRLRVELRAAYTRETNLTYYGLGNAAPRPPDADIPARDFYGRIHPTALARARGRLGGAFHLQVGTLYSQNWLDVDPGSHLVFDWRTGDARTRELLRVHERHGLLLFELALAYDQRDNEISTATGNSTSSACASAPGRPAACPTGTSGSRACSGSTCPRSRTGWCWRRGWWGTCSWVTSLFTSSPASTRPPPWAAPSTCGGYLATVTTVSASCSRTSRAGSR